MCWQQAFLEDCKVVSDIGASGERNAAAFPAQVAQKLHLTCSHI